MVRTSYQSPVPGRARDSLCTLEDLRERTQRGLGAGRDLSFLRRPGVDVALAQGDAELRCLRDRGRCATPGYRLSDVGGWGSAGCRGAAGVGTGGDGRGLMQ